jgi:hypothetical protein
LALAVGSVPESAESQDTAGQESSTPAISPLAIAKRVLEWRLIVGVLLVGGTVIALSSISGITGSFPDAVVLVARQFAVGLVVAGLGAVLIPRLLKKDELKDALVEFVRTDVKREIKKQTAAIEAQTDKLYAASASLSALQAAQISRVYTRRGDANSDLARDLEIGSSRIRVLGLSLNDMLGNNAVLPESWRRLSKIIEATGKADDPTDVKILLIDPNGVGGALRSEGEGDSGDTTKLAHDVDEALDELFQLLDKHRENGGGSFDFRLYRIAPQLFFCLTDTVAYVQPYYFQRSTKVRHGEPPLPLIRCEGRDLLDDLRNHFDLIWDFAAVTAEAYRYGHAVGTDQGAASAAVVSIFSSPQMAARRMRWMIQDAAKKASAPKDEAHPDAGRLWVQGNSLDSFFGARETGLYDAVRHAVECGADTRVLLLHPYSTQAYYRSYRESLLSPGGEGLSFSDYCGSGKHEQSRLVRDTEQTIRQILELRDGKTKIAVQLYSTAPFCFLLLTDDRAMVEQYHLGKHDPRDAQIDSRILGKDMPIVEYRREPRGPLKFRPNRSPYALLESHFNFVWDHDVARDATEEDVDPRTARSRACELELASLGAAPDLADDLPASPTPANVLRDAATMIVDLLAPHVHFRGRRRAVDRRLS